MSGKGGGSSGGGHSGSSGHSGTGKTSSRSGTSGTGKTSRTGKTSSRNGTKTGAKVDTKKGSTKAGVKGDPKKGKGKTGKQERLKGTVKPERYGSKLNATSLALSYSRMHPNVSPEALKARLAKEVREDKTKGLSVLESIVHSIKEFGKEVGNKFINDMKNDPAKRDKFINDFIKGLNPPERGLGVKPGDRLRKPR